MNRNHLKNLQLWYQEPNRKPLILRGARQVGKSTLVRDFAKSEGLILHEVNLERYQYLKNIFVSFKVDDFLKEVQLICSNGKVNLPNSILFIDEIQAIPEALQFLRYLYEDYPELPVISAGSLLEFALQDESNAISMPVGRINYLFLGPCTFNEFLAGKGDSQILDHLLNYKIGENLSPLAHQKLLQQLKTYLLVGGMPEALQSYIETEDFSQSHKILSSIMLTYRDDFLKYAKRTSLQNLQKVLDYAPSGIGRKVKYVNIDEHTKAVDLRAAIRLLEMAGVVNLAYCTNATLPPLSSAIDSKAFKLFTLDCGILNAISKLRIARTDAKLINEDDLAEQFVAQHLRYLGNSYQPPELYYWLREGKANNAEVDFLYQFENSIIPIEVKSGTAGSLRSLHQYIHRSKSKIAVRFDLNPPSLQHVQNLLTGRESEKVDFKLLSLPLYMIGELDRLLHEITSVQ
jgi:predicted AAA+ superfamily ATPase